MEKSEFSAALKRDRNGLTFENYSLGDTIKTARNKSMVKMLTS